MEQELKLPVLRQDLNVTPGAPGEDGAPTWLLYDPLKNQYYRLGQTAFAMLRCWQGGVSAPEWLKDLQSQESSIEEGDLEIFLDFLAVHGLTEVSTPQEQKRLEDQEKRLRKGVVKWLLTQYLFIRVPLFRPDHFLEKTLPSIDFLFRPVTRSFILFLGCIGFLLVVRQWDVFFSSILHFFSLEGAFFFAVTLFFVKAFHELGHAYTAKRMGCRVPTIGVAFLVLYPFLYTDTTDAWKLTSRKHRLAIVTAGVKAELALALIALFLWSFLDNGILKSAAFFVTTTSLITSLSINLSPFMRFDGYYALSDFLGAENLQQRAFALARWRLREFFFGLGEPIPESLPTGRKNIFILYAYATWIYRFFLFLGIALLVYHFTFKALGILLFVVELVYFIGLPIMNEMKIWWKNRHNMSLNRNFVFTLCGTTMLVILLFLPWQKQVRLPAVLEANHQADIFPPEDAKIVSFDLKKGEMIQKGDLLFTLSFPQLEKEQTMLERRIVYLQTRIDRHIGSAADLSQFQILRREQVEAKSKLSGIVHRMARGAIIAPQSGQLAELIQAHPGQWVSNRTKLTQIVGREKTEVTAYLEESQLHRVRVGALATFYSNNDELSQKQAKVMGISATSVSSIEHPEVTSIFGGSIAVYAAGDNNYHPQSGIYKIILQTETYKESLPWRIVGQVNIETPAQSPFSHFWRYAASVFIRESGM